jgi:hypothetical protein
MVDLANQPFLPGDRGLQLGLVPGDRPRHPLERLAEGFDLLRRGLKRGQIEAAIARLVGGDHLLDPAQRAEQQPLDQDPADQRGPEPHQHRGENGEDLAGADRRRPDPNAQRVLAVHEREVGGDFALAG